MLLKNALLHLVCNKNIKKTAIKSMFDQKSKLSCPTVRFSFPNSLSNRTFNFFLMSFTLLEDLPEKCYSLFLVEHSHFTTICPSYKEQHGSGIQIGFDSHQ